jgi:hypothetical protein
MLIAVRIPQEDTVYGNRITFVLKCGIQQLIGAEETNSPEPVHGLIAAVIGHFCGL